MTDTGLPPDLPGPAQPNYGATPQPPAQPQSTPPAQPNPYAQYPQQPYGQPQYPYPVKSNGMSTGAKVGLFAGLGCLVLIIIPVIVIIVISVVAAASSSSYDYEPWEPPTSADDDADDGNTVGYTELMWKSGDDWLTPPAGDTAPTPFMAGYATPEDYLNYAMGEYNMQVIFTDDPAYNCGFSKATAQPDWVIGCYNPDYGNTIFLWWGPEAVDDMKALILLHEYSHYYQNYYYFDATHSAVEADLFNDPEFVQDVWETDATCRVYDDWHYTNLEYLDSYTVSPCGDTGWGPHWFENELLERGVTITDY